MACKSSHTISGSSNRSTAYYTSRSTAESYARGMADPYGRVLAGLEFNGFHCPNPACSEKIFLMGKVTITSVSSSFSLLATVFWLEKRYSATVYFDWEATIECTGKEGNDELDVEGFIEEFKKAVKIRSKEVYTLANGDLGNFFTAITFGGIGDGCVAWALWALEWVYNCKWFNGKLIVKQAHIGSFPFLHQIVIICFPNGTELVLDPWRDKENPVYPKGDYDKKYGPIKPDFSQ